MFGFLYERYYGNIQDCVIIIDYSGKVLYYNKKCNELFEEVFFPIKSIYELIPEEVGNSHIIYIKNFIKSKKAMSNKSISYGNKNLHITVLPLSFKRIIVLINDQTELTIFKNFFNKTNQMMCLASKDGTFVKVNECMSRTLGYSITEFVNKPLILYTHPSDIEKTCEILNKITTDKTDIEFTNRYRNSKGEYIHLSWKCCSIQENIYAFALNITDYSISKEELIITKKFLDIIEDLGITGIWKFDVNTREMEWSDGLKKIYGVEEISYDKYMEMNYPQDLGKISRAMTDCLLDKLPYKIEHRILNQATKQIRYITSSAIYISEIMTGDFIIGVVHDITNDINIKNDLLRSKEKAEKNDDIKSMFVASVSHEIRSPLHCIINMIDLLKMNCALQTKEIEYIDILSNSCELLMSIINNILDFSKIEKEQEKVEKNDIFIKNFITENVKIFKYNCSQKKIFFNVDIYDDIPEVIHTDETKLKQILYNILSNSLKFTLIGGITLLVFKKAKHLCIEIKDTGIGIDKEQQKNIFKPFYQIENTITKKFQGSGLGLAISKSYCDLLNIDISFISHKNLGTSFILKIPI
jgi:PAS domain S-box-containing protein